MNNTGTIGLDLSSTLQVNGNMTNSGAITLSFDCRDCFPGAGLTVGGTLTNNLGGALVLYGMQDTATMPSLNNSGIVDLENESTLRVNGNVSNAGQITTSSYGNGVAVGNTVSITGKLTNSAGGTFSLAAASDSANVSFISNAGSVYLASGTNLNVTGGARSSANTLPGFLNTGIVDISSGATIGSPLSFTQTSGQTTVDGSLRVSSRGLIDFAGGSVYGDQGTIQGTVLSNAAINIGDSPLTIGQLTFAGNYTQGANGSLTFDIAGPTAGEYDQLNVSGHAQLGGLMTVDLLHSYAPQIGNTFDIMNFASASGTFSMVVGLPINNQEHFVLEYNPTNLTLDVAAGQLFGPTAGHGSSFSSEPFITTSQQAGGDNYSLTVSSDNGPSGSTPEPCSIVLFGSSVIGLVGLLCRSR
jgi:hypothetical protein